MKPTKDHSMLQITRLMFGSQLARHKARNSLRRQGFTERMLSQLNRQGELKTGITTDDFYLGDPRRLKSSVQKVNKPSGQVPPDWYLNKQTREIEWLDSSEKKAGYIHLGQDITFTFNSYIDASRWDGPLPGSWVGGSKLTTSIIIDATPGIDGSLAEVDIRFGEPKIGKTFGIFGGQESVERLPTVESQNVQNPRRFSARLERHTMVHPLEETGLKGLGYEPVNVAQRLQIQNNQGTLGISASTDVFPSATLKVRGSEGSATLFKYRQPSFEATHKQKYKIRGSGYPAPTINRRTSPYKFYKRYASGN